MTFKHMFLSAAAASSLMLAVAAAPPAVFSWATKAQAATNISTSINFYDELAPYGNWVSYQDRYVWIPEGVDDGWRPYTEGHWAYTRSYGWVWVSDEKFGWATYHYGRWGKAPDIGWYWVPGRRWAPAWVAWSYDNYDLAWAPLPPVHYDGVNDDISPSDIPDDYWQALSVSAFLADDLSSHMFRDRDKVGRIIERGKSWTVSIENNIVVNNVLTIDNIEKRTKKKVVALEERAVDSPDAARKADSTSVAIFKPEVKEEPNARPKKIAKIEEVVKEREAKGIPEQEPPEQTATTTGEPVTKPKKDKATSAVVPQDELPREIKSQASGARWAIQLASVRNPNEAKVEWRRLRGRFKDLLGGKKLTVVRAHLGERGIFYRLRIGGFQHKSNAVMLCDSIKAKGGNCLAILIRQSNAE